MQQKLQVEKDQGYEARALNKIKIYLTTLRLILRLSVASDDDGDDEHVELIRSFQIR